MPTRVSIGKRREKQCAGVRAHVQAVRHQRDRSEHETADDFGAHHRAAEPNHGPGFALTLVVPLAQEYMLMERRFGGFGIDGHDGAHFK